MVGIVDVFVEGRRWVRCSAKMDDSNSLRLTSMEACAVDIHLAMSTTTSIHLGGSSWKSLRMKCRSAGETNEELVTYIHPQGDDEMRRWLRVIHRATHVPLFKEEHAEWTQLVYYGKGPDTEKGWTAAWTVLMSNGQLLWKASEFSPVTRGGLDLHGATSVKVHRSVAAAMAPPLPKSVADSGGQVLEVVIGSRAQGQRLLLAGCELGTWLKLLNSALDVCRRNNEAKRLLRGIYANRRPSDPDASFSNPAPPTPNRVSSAETLSSKASSWFQGLGRRGSGELESQREEAAPPTPSPPHPTHPSSPLAAEALSSWGATAGWLSVRHLGDASPKRRFCVLRLEASGSGFLEMHKAGRGAAKGGLTSPRDGSTTIRLDELVLLHAPADVAAPHAEVRLVTMREVWVLSADGASTPSLSTWLSQLEALPAPGHAADAAVKALPPLATPALHSGWLSRPSERPACRPKFYRLVKAEWKEELALECFAAAPPGAAAALVAMPKEGVSLAQVRAVEPRSEPAEQSGVLGFFSPRKRGAAPTTEPTAVFELVGARRDHGVFDAHATALAGGWVAAIKEKLGGGKKEGSSGELPAPRRASQLVSGDV